jgi:hypothetical protein
VVSAREAADGALVAAGDDRRAQLDRMLVAQLRGERMALVSAYGVVRPW